MRLTERRVMVLHTKPVLCLTLKCLFVSCVICGAPSVVTRASHSPWLVLPAPHLAGAGELDAHPQLCALVRTPDQQLFGVKLRPALAPSGSHHGGLKIQHALTQRLS